MDNLTDRQMLETMIRVTHAVKMAGLRAYVKHGEYKTEDSYRRQVWRIVRELFNGEIDEYAFVDDFSGFIDNQFTRAWNAGAREMGVNPRQFTDDDIAYLAERIADEQGYMLQLADDIMRARDEGQSIEQFRARADAYANRYNEMVNEARTYFGGKQMLEWMYGDTEHCEDCQRLNGIVATAQEWHDSGWTPQSRGLQCGGYHCQCQLLPTDKPPTPGGIPG